MATKTIATWAPPDYECVITTEKDPTASLIPLTQLATSEKTCDKCYWWNQWGCNNTNWMGGEKNPLKPVCDGLGFKEASKK